MTTTSAGGGIGHVASYKADGDLSTFQYCFVGLTAANTVGTTSIGTGMDVEGILQNKPEAANSPAVVQFDGVSKLKMGGTLAYGAWIAAGTDATGIALTAAGSENIRAKALEACSGIGDIISVRMVEMIGSAI